VTAKPGDTLRLRARLLDQQVTAIQDEADRKTDKLAADSAALLRAADILDTNA
jgi:hypothetical protein